MYASEVQRGAGTADCHSGECRINLHRSWIPVVELLRSLVNIALTTSTMGLFDDYLSFATPAGPSALPPQGTHLLLTDALTASANVVLYHLFMSANVAEAPVSLLPLPRSFPFPTSHLHPPRIHPRIPRDSLPSAIWNVLVAHTRSSGSTSGTRPSRPLTPSSAASAPPSSAYPTSPPLPFHRPWSLHPLPQTRSPPSSPRSHH